MALPLFLGNCNWAQRQARSRSIAAGGLSRITRPKLQVTERQPKLSSWKCTRANLYVKGFYQAAAMQPSGGELAQHTWALGPVPSKAKPKQSSGYPPLNLWAVGLSPRNQAVIVAF